jgi:hypothetical protein
MFPHIPLKLGFIPTLIKLGYYTNSDKDLDNHKNGYVGLHPLRE